MLCVVCVSALCRAQTTRPAPPAFASAIWSQPIANFPALKEMGVNVLLGHEPESGKVSKRQWEDAAAAAGFFFVSVPGEDLAAEAKQPYRLAWLQDDEPDLNRWRASEPADSPNNRNLIPSGSYKGWTKPELLAERYARCKAAAPAMPLLVNFNGRAITPEAYTHGNGHKPYIAAADILCHDWYPYSWGYAHTGTRFIALSIDRLARWSGGKPQWAYYEGGWQKKTEGRQLTPDELELQIETAVGCGASGVVCFAHRFDIGWPGGWLAGVTADHRARIRLLSDRFIQSQWPPARDPTLTELVKARGPRGTRVSGRSGRSGGGGRGRRGGGGG